MLTELAVLLSLVVVVGCSSAAEAALAKQNRGRLRHLASEGVPKARSLLALVEHGASLETSLVAANVAAVALSAMALFLLAGDAFGFGSPAAFATLAGGLIGILWVQTAFRSAGSYRPETVLYLLRVPVRVTRVLLLPLALLLIWLTRLVFPEERHLFGWKVSAIEEELRMMVESAEEDGSLEAEEKEMIEGIFTLGERTVREIMVPRVDVAAVDANEALREVLDKIKTRGHSRIPIYDETIDNIVGIVYAKDLLRHMETGSLDQPARSIARYPHFIPESKKIDELLREMQADKVHIAIVVDEYGGTAGLVTIEDLLEEIVGEIQDEYDMEEKAIEKLSDREAVFNARVSIHEVNETLDVMLANGEYDTIGGLVYNRLGKIPVVGDEINVDGVSIAVLSTAGKRIKKVKVVVESDGSTERNQVGRD